MIKINSRIDSQKKSIIAMIKLYCNKNHNTKEELCFECLDLVSYAIQRLENCVFGEDKPSCGRCKIHCYKKDMRVRILKVMRYSGPRMLIYNPKIAVEHLIDNIKFR